MTLSIADQNKLDAFWSYCVKNQYFNIGYPESADFDYTILERFMRFSINNCGDWGEYCNYLLNSFDFEKEVMEYFARIFKIPFEESWGYVTNGGTEGNMFGCYLGRELFPEGTLYYSKDTHYSVAKLVKLLRIKSSLVESQPNGEMDYDDLIRKIQRDNESIRLFLQISAQPFVVLLIILLRSNNGLVSWVSNETIIIYTLMLR